MLFSNIMVLYDFLQSSHGLWMFQLPFLPLIIILIMIISHLDLALPFQ